MNVHATPISITRVELFFPVNGDVVEVFAREATIVSELAAHKEGGASAITRLIFTENEAVSEATNAMHLRNLKAAASSFNAAFFSKWVSAEATFECVSNWARGACFELTEV